MFSHEGQTDEVIGRRRRRRVLAVAAIIILVLLLNLGFIASITEPTFLVQSATVEGIDIPTHTLDLAVTVSVNNQNWFSAHLLGVDGDVYSSEKKIGSFYSHEDVTVPARANISLDFHARISNVSMPLPDPLLVVKGKARLRAWIVGVTYHFEHSIPLTYSADKVNRPPVAVINSQSFARRGAPVSFDGSSSYDPDGTVVGWSWDFGDGSTAEGAITSHTFVERGTFDVVLTVADQMGATSQSTWTIRVLVI